MDDHVSSGAHVPHVETMISPLQRKITISSLILQASSLWKESRIEEGPNKVLNVGQRARERGTAIRNMYRDRFTGRRCRLRSSYFRSRDRNVKWESIIERRASMRWQRDVATWLTSTCRENLRTCTHWNNEQYDKRDYATVHPLISTRHLRIFNQNEL